MITIALLRIDGKKSAAPPPFEQPKPNSNFWVLELPVPRNKEKAQIDWLATALMKRRKLIVQQITGRSTATLFLELSPKRSKPVVFGSAFIHVISTLGLSLEVYEEEA